MHLVIEASAVVTGEKEGLFQGHSEKIDTFLRVLFFYYSLKRA